MHTNKQKIKYKVLCFIPYIASALLPNHMTWYDLSEPQDHSHLSQNMPQLLQVLVNHYSTFQDFVNKLSFIQLEYDIIQRLDYNN